jgi:SAM-dependent methyltransferase
MTRSSHTTAETLTAVNRRHYDNVWQGISYRSPSSFNTWSTLFPLAAEYPQRLEIGPGMWPRLPVDGTSFIDLSPVAVKNISVAGGLSILGNINDLPFPDKYFNLICAFDVVEHVSDERRVIMEISRVLKDNGLLFFSVPLHEKHWTNFDHVVGHYHRFDPHELIELLAENDLVLEQSTNFGSKPRSKKIVSFGFWFFKYFRRITLFVHRRLAFPVSLRFQRSLVLQEGLIDTSEIEEILLVCRRTPRGARVKE